MAIRFSIWLYFYISCNSRTNGRLQAGFNEYDKKEFRKVNIVFQEQLNCDIKRIKNNNKIFVSADKSRKTYTLQQEGYTKLLKENITIAYKKSTCKKLLNINRTAKKSQKNCQSLIG